MKIIDCVQGEASWYKARLGLPTASNFHKVVTPKTGQLSKQSRTYAYRLIAERLLNVPTDNIQGIEHIERGRELEPLAADQYAFVNEVELERVGLIVTDDGLLGASPDRIIKGQARGLEIKVPAPWTHIGYLLDGMDDDYRCQVQGSLHVSEFERWDLYSYCDRMPAFSLPTYRDEPFIKLLADALAAFNEQLFEMEQRARSMGLFQAYADAVTPQDVELADEARRELDETIFDGIDAPKRGTEPDGFFRILTATDDIRPASITDWQFSCRAQILSISTLKELGRFADMNAANFRKIAERYPFEVEAIELEIRERVAELRKL